jgi:hypothetical protein
MSLGEEAPKGVETDNDVATYSEFRSVLCHSYKILSSRLVWATYKKIGTLDVVYVLLVIVYGLLLIVQNTLCDSGCCGSWHGLGLAPVLSSLDDSAALKGLWGSN